jgi:hypothetical protein
VENQVNKRRELFYWIQLGILALLVIITCFTFLAYNNMQIDKSIKILFAPFLSIVPLVFALSVIKDWIQTFKETDYTRQEIIRYTTITLVVALAFVGVTKLISLITATEILIAVIIAIISIVSFISMRIRDILGMSIFTGIAEGIIIYMVFLF